MQSTEQIQALIGDLKILTEELELNPQLSSWTVRLVLKSIIDKAQRNALQSSPTSLPPRTYVHLK